MISDERIKYLQSENLRTTLLLELLEERKKLLFIVQSWNAGIHHRECAACLMTEKPFEAWKENND